MSFRLNLTRKMNMQFLEQVLKQQQPSLTKGTTHNFEWQILDEGVMSLTPHVAAEKMVVISAGVHGNETAPIEILEHIFQALCSNQLTLNVNLLLILGNPEAIRAGKRFVEYDINRMFCGAHKQLPEFLESKRAAQLEFWLDHFFKQNEQIKKRYHYDLHTAIRGSKLPTFAMLPYQQQAYDAELLNHLNAAELDALVYHNTAGKTFTHFSSEYFQAASATLELGQAKPFGQNDLSQFHAIDQVLRAIISQQALPKRTKAPLRSFKVTDSILKTSEDFKLNLDSAAPNFSMFQKGEVITFQHGKDDLIASQDVYILFPNPNVALGLRAGLILSEIV